VVPTAVKREQATCGQIVECEVFEDQDQEVLITQELIYACGCLSLRHEYHDGSVSLRVVHHGGKVLVDDLRAAE